MSPQDFPQQHISPDCQQSNQSACNIFSEFNRHESRDFSKKCEGGRKYSNLARIKF